MSPPVGVLLHNYYPGFLYTDEYTSCEVRVRIVVTNVGLYAVRTFNVPDNLCSLI